MLEINEHSKYCKFTNTKIELESKWKKVGILLKKIADQGDVRN